LFFLIRDTTLSSLAFECGRIRTVLATTFILPNLWVPFPSFNDDSYIPRSHPCKNWMMISHHFPHLQTLFGLHLIPDFLGNKTRGQIQLDNMYEHGKLLRPLAVPMVEDTFHNVPLLITVLHNEHHINETTKKWLFKHQTHLEFQYFIPL